MKLFRPAGLFRADDSDKDWTREHGLAQVSEFPYPDVFLHEKIVALTEADGQVENFLQDCLRRFVNHDYGNIISMDQVENFLSREIKKENTWMQAIYPSEKWGNIHLEIFFDVALFHLEDVAPRDLALEQRRKERESK